jgi:hypothetical protein
MAYCKVISQIERVEMNMLVILLKTSAAVLEVNILVILLKTSAAVLREISSGVVLQVVVGRTGGRCERRHEKVK